MVVILIGGTILGLIPAFIAQKKGYDFILWWLLGALLFIVALPAILLISPNKEGIEKQQLAGGYRKCPRCAELIKREAQVCKHCGHNLSTSGKVVARPSWADCPRCGQLVVDVSKPCSSCGEIISDSSIL